MVHIGESSNLYRSAQLWREINKNRHYHEILIYTGKLEKENLREIYKIQEEIGFDYIFFPPKQGESLHVESLFPALEADAALILGDDSQNEIHPDFIFLLAGKVISERFCLGGINNYLMKCIAEKVFSQESGKAKLLIEHNADCSLFDFAKKIMDQPVRKGLKIPAETAVVIKRGRILSVFGEQQALLVDASNSLAEENTEDSFSIENLHVHLIGSEQVFDLDNFSFASEAVVNGPLHAGGYIWN